MLVGAGIALAGALLVARFMPAREPAAGDEEARPAARAADGLPVVAVAATGVPAPIR